jgi:hypothetical protein
MYAYSINDFVTVRRRPPLPSYLAWYIYLGCTMLWCTDLGIVCIAVAEVGRVDTARRGFGVGEGVEGGGA